MSKIPIILKPGRADGKLAESQSIYDSILEQFQSSINGEYKLTKQQVEFLLPIVERLNDVQDTLTSIEADKPLSAQQGKILKELLDAKVIEAGAVPMDEEPTEGNISHVVTSDGIAKSLQANKIRYNSDNHLIKTVEDALNKHNNTIFDIIKTLYEYEEFVSLLQDNTYYIVDNNGYVIVKINADGIHTTSVNATSVNTIFIESENKSFNVVDYYGNIIAIIDDQGVKSLDFKTKDGITLSSRLGVDVFNVFKTDIESKIFDINQSLTKLLDIIDDKQDDCFYVIDKNNNIIAKIDKNGIHTTNVEAQQYITEDNNISIIDNNGYILATINKDGIHTNIINTNIIKSEDNNICITDYFGNIICTLTSDGLKTTNVSTRHIETDSDSISIIDLVGNIICKIDKDGIHTTHVYSKDSKNYLSPRYEGKHIISIGDSHTQRHQFWFPYLANRMHAVHDTDVQNYSIGSNGANVCAPGYEDCVNPMLSQAYRIVEQYKNGKPIDIVFIENVHFVYNNIAAKDAIPFNPKQIIDLGYHKEDIDSWWNANFIESLTSKTIKIGSLVKLSYGIQKYKLTFTGNPVPNTQFILTIDNHEFKQPINSGDSLNDVVTGLASFDFGQYIDWQNSYEDDSIYLTYKGENTTPKLSISTNDDSGIEVTYNSVSTIAYRYYYFLSRDKNDWLDITKWKVWSEFAGACSAINGVIEYLQQNIPNVELIMLGLPDYSPSKEDVLSMTDDLGIDVTKWINHKDFISSLSRKETIKQSAELYHLKYIDIDSLMGVNPNNWTTYFDYGNVHPKVTGYIHWSDIIIRELGI